MSEAGNQGAPPRDGGGEEVPGALDRVALLVGPGGLARLRQARVAVIGLGAVGSFATEALARTGVGNLRLVDFDRVAPSNLNRQLFALTTTIGRPKVEVAAERVRTINPAVRLECHESFFDSETADELLRGPLDYVIDAIDALNPKIQLILAARQRGLRCLSSMGAANRMDPSRVRVGDLFQAGHCPLARRVRKRLRRQGVDRGVMAIWSEEPPVAPTGAAELHGIDCSQGEDDAGPSSTLAQRGRPRVVQPSLCPIPAIFGLTAAAEVIRSLLGTRRGDRAS